MKNQNRAANTKVIQKKITPTIQVPRGFGYKSETELQFEVSYDKSGLSIVTSCGDDIDGSCTNRELSLIGLLTYNVTITGLEPISSQSKMNTLVVSKSGTIAVNEELGIATSEEEVQQIIDESIQVIIGELELSLRLEDGTILMFDPDNAEEFYDYFNGMDELVLLYDQNVYVVVGQGPIS